jgi:hypothetical protein
VIWLQLAASLYMTGVIWCVQLVHYPLMAMVSADRSISYHRRHTARIGWVVIGPMIVEAACAGVLLWPGVEGVSRPVAAAGLALVALIWASTFALQVPCHRRLAAGFDAGVHRRLLRSNWLRTVAWTARGVLVIAVAAQT